MMWEPSDTPTAGAANPYNDGASAATKADGGEPGQRHPHGCVVLRFDGGTELQTYLYMTSQMAGFPNSPSYSTVTPTTSFRDEFFYAPEYFDGGFNYGQSVGP